MITVLFLAVNIIQKAEGQDGGPVISVPDETLTVSIEDGEDTLLQGVTAQDGRDGDVTSSVLVESISNFYGDEKRLVTFAAFDSDGNVTKATRAIQYSDYTAHGSPCSTPSAIRQGRRSTWRSWFRPRIAWMGT
ncbi:MAG: DUF5011 domain-containing protein [Clostridiales bacterium]|nr:DUF5011 domain-containing protein [Clostridiales bacterium]